MTAAGSEFESLAEVDTATAESIVELLTSRAIPAFIEPLGDATRCRVVVDSEHLEQARTLMHDQLGKPGSTPTGETSGEVATGGRDEQGMTLEQVDTAWLGIVADLSDLHIPDDLGGDSGSADESYRSGLSSRLVRRHGPEAGPRDYELREAEEEGYSPPEPPPLPRPRDHVDRFAWGATIGGPVVLVASNVFAWGTWVGGLGVAGFIAGFATLIARMRTERDDSDPGAVV